MYLFKQQKRNSNANDKLPPNILTYQPKNIMITDKLLIKDKIIPLNVNYPRKKKRDNLYSNLVNTEPSLSKKTEKN